jgi:hypothetical protein
MTQNPYLSGNEDDDIFSDNASSNADEESRWDSAWSSNNESVGNIPSYLSEALTRFGDEMGLSSMAALITSGGPGSHLKGKRSPFEITLEAVQSTYDWQLHHFQTQKKLKHVRENKFLVATSDQLYGVINQLLSSIAVLDTSHIHSLAFFESMLKVANHVFVKPDAEITEDKKTEILRCTNFLSTHRGVLDSHGIWIRSDLTDSYLKVCENYSIDPHKDVLDEIYISVWENSISVMDLDDISQKIHSVSRGFNGFVQFPSELKV